MKAYGITEAAPGVTDPVLAQALEELARNGFTILADALTAAIGETGQARALLEEAVFLDILRCAPLDAGVVALLGPAVLVMQQNGIVMPPGGAEHHQQSWHRDPPYQSWVCSKPIALGALAVLDDFTEESGATLFLPGSHAHATFPSEGFAARWAKQAEARASSIVVFDAMCFHRGGVNRGRAPRRAENTLYGVPLLARQVCFTEKPGLEPAVLWRLGLDYQPSPSADAWRESRAARLTVPRWPERSSPPSVRITRPRWHAMVPRRRGWTGRITMATGCATASSFALLRMIPRRRCSTWAAAMAISWPSCARMAIAEAISAPTFRPPCLTPRGQGMATSSCTVSSSALARRNPRITRLAAAF